MTLKEIIEEREFAIHTPIALAFFLISGFILSVSVIIPYIHSYSKNIGIDIGIILFISFVIYITWYYNRSVFPKLSNEKHNFIIAIQTENSKQKSRIAKDYANEINKQLIKYQLNKSYKVVVLNNNLSRVLENKFNEYVELKMNNEIQDENNIDFLKIKNKLNAKFIIYGNLIKRNTENSTYLLSIDAILTHTKTNINQGSVIQRQFSEIWKNEVSILENEELTGFKTNAKNHLFTALYMIALSTFTDNKYLLGIDIYNTLELYIQDKEELNSYLGKIKELRSIMYFLQSRIYYFNGEYERSMHYRDLYQEQIPNQYDKYLTEAIKYTKLRNDPETALEFVYKAKAISKGNGIWRYSMLYLLIKLNKHKEAITVLQELEKNNFRDETDCIMQTISYNQNCLKEDSNHIQSNFIIGALKFKKLKNPTDAYYNLEKFISDTKEKAEWLVLHNEAKSILKEINQIIGLEE